MSDAATAAVRTREYRIMGEFLWAMSANVKYDAILSLEDA
jgi:hypothetical protein